MIEIILFLLTAAVILAAGICVCCYKDFKHYRRVYRTLPSKKFYKQKDYVRAFSLKGNPYEFDFVWFNDGNFCLDADVYLFDAGFTRASLYGWYWLAKYQRWCRKNLKPENLKEWKESEQ